MLSTLAALSGCDYYDHRLKVVNKLPYPVCLMFGHDTVPDMPSINSVDFYLMHKLAPNDTSHEVLPEARGWEKLVYRSKNKKLNLYVYGYHELLSSRSIDAVTKAGAYRTVRVGLADLEKNNWVVIIDSVTAVGSSK